MMDGIMGGGIQGCLRLNKRTDRFAESNRTSTNGRGCKLLVGLIGGPIQPTVTEIFLFYLWGADRATSLKKICGGGG